jgi:hypothetical protein
MPKLWLRIGDEDSYECFNELSEVAEILRQAFGGGDSLENVRMVAGGFTAEGYKGNNYISLYWGDKNADMIRSLTRKEFIVLINAVDPAIFGRDRLADMLSPDGQGSEYRCVYEFMEDIVNQIDADNNFGLVQTSLDEMIEACRMFKRGFKKPY